MSIRVKRREEEILEQGAEPERGAPPSLFDRYRPNVPSLSETRKMLTTAKSGFVRKTSDEKNKQTLELLLLVIPHIPFLPRRFYRTSYVVVDLSTRDYRFTDTVSLHQVRIRSET